MSSRRLGPALRHRDSGVPPSGLHDRTPGSGERTGAARERGSQGSHNPQELTQSRNERGDRRAHGDDSHDTSNRGYNSSDSGSPSHRRNPEREASRDPGSRKRSLSRAIDNWTNGGRKRLKLLYVFRFFLVIC
jgi:hypothetical protein